MPATPSRALDAHIAKIPAERRPRDPRPFRRGAGGADSRHPRADRRLGRPDRLEQHHRQGHDRLRRPRLRRPLCPLRRARVRHGRGDERHGPARRPDPLFRHLPGLRRLQPRGDPAGRADGRAGDPRDDPRLRSALAKTARPPAGRAPGLAAGHAEPPGVPPRRRGRDRRVLGAALEDRNSPSIMARRARRPRRSARARRRHRSAGAYELAPADGVRPRRLIFASGTGGLHGDCRPGAAAGRGHRRAGGLAPCWEISPSRTTLTGWQTIGVAPIRIAVEAGRTVGLGALHRRGRRASSA